MLGRSGYGLTTVVTNVANAPSTSPGASVTPGSGTKGSWVSLISGANNTTGFDFLEIRVSNAATAGSTRDILLDIGIDPSGGTSYSVLLPDIICGQAHNAISGGVFYHVPITVPRGASIAARAQSNSTTALRVSIWAYKAGRRTEQLPTFTAVESIGAISGNVGVSFTPGNSGAEGSWAQLGTLSNNARYLLPMFGISNGTHSALVYYFDIGAGPAGSQVVVLTNLMYNTTSTSEQTLYVSRNPLFFYVDLPSGTDLWVRGSCSGNANTGWHARLLAFS